MSYLDNDLETQELIGLLDDRSNAPAPLRVLPSDASAGAQKAMVGGAYESADRNSRELVMWRPSFGSADNDILYDKEMIDARSRDTVRNDAFVSSGQTIRKDSIVGSLFMLNCKPAWSVLGLDEVWAEEFQEEVETKFTLYAESVGKYADAARRSTLTEQARLAVGMDLMAGEVLATSEWITDDPTRPFSTAFQMIDPDRLSTPPGVDLDLITRNRVRGGIRRNRRGEPLGYYIRQSHPSDWGNLQDQSHKYVPVRKPWGRQQVIHIFEQFRPDQTRGVSALVAALKETRLSRQFRDVMLQNAVVNATYAASIESELPAQEVFAQLGGGRNDDLASLASKYAAGYLGAIGAYMKDGPNTTLNGVRIPHLFPGTKLQLHPAGQGGPLGTDFEKSLIRYIAAALGVSYEQVSKDFGGINYSTLKGSLNETYKAMQARKRFVADTYATHFFMCWLEEAIAKGEITSLSKRAPNFWEGLNREAYCQCEWVGASRGQIDELKETQAAVLRVNNNLSTLEDEHARLGKDWRKTLEQREREQAVLKERGLDRLQTDTTNMMNAASGEADDKGEESDK